MDKNISRKAFLKNLSILGVATIGGSALLNSCGGEEKKTAAPKKEEPKAVADASDPCSDLSGLTEADLKMRENLKYVAKTPDPAKPCTACNFWVAPAEGATCGGCTLIKGPIHPDGYCASFVVKPAAS
jgi:hypothetical protein